MANTLKIGLGLLVLVGVGVQIGIALYRRFTWREQDDEEYFAAEVKRQLNHELNEAIESSAKSPLPLLNEDPSTPLARPHVRFADQDENTDTKSDGKTNDLRNHTILTTDHLDAGRRPYVNGINLDRAQAVGLAHQSIIPPGPRTANHLEGPLVEAPLFVNAKQYERILKRRIARQSLEDRFRAQRLRQDAQLQNKGFIRRARGPGGRFLTISWDLRGL